MPTRNTPDLRCLLHLARWLLPLVAVLFTIGVPAPNSAKAVIEPMYTLPSSTVIRMVCGYHLTTILSMGGTWAWITLSAPLAPANLSPRQLAGLRSRAVTTTAPATTSC
jgi:hypothetical protein